MLNFISGAAALWNLILLLLASGTIVWFLYFFVLRRLMRARRINGARERRLLREAAEREFRDQK